MKVYKHSFWFLFSPDGSWLPCSADSGKMDSWKAQTNRSKNKFSL